MNQMLEVFYWRTIESVNLEKGSKSILLYTWQGEEVVYHDRTIFLILVEMKLNNDGNPSRLHGIFRYSNLIWFISSPNIIDNIAIHWSAAIFYYQYTTVKPPIPSHGKTLEVLVADSKRRRQNLRKNHNLVGGGGGGGNWKKKFAKKAKSTLLACNTRWLIQNKQWNCQIWEVKRKICIWGV